MPERYNVYLWWWPPDPGCWRLRFRNVRLWRLRDRLRRLYGEGWSPVSILVERADA